MKKRDDNKNRSVIAFRQIYGQKTLVRLRKEESLTNSSLSVS